MIPTEVMLYTLHGPSACQAYAQRVMVFILHMPSARPAYTREVIVFLYAEAALIMASPCSLLGPEAEMIPTEVMLCAGQKHGRHVFCAPIHR